MTEPAVIVGIGQPGAGDDGVGVAVAHALAARGLDARACADASLVLALLDAGRRVVVVDAVVDAPAGAVRALDVAALAAAPPPWSSHGVGVVAAIQIARALHGDSVLARLAIVGIAIARPGAPALGLSPAVAAAIAPAAALACALQVA
jgi:hydrogenase maturation protease